MRLRLRRGHRRPSFPRYRRRRPDRAGQPRASRRERVGEEHRRRRRHHHADPPPLPRRTSRPSPGVRLRGKGGYGVGMVFLPQDKISRVDCFRLFEQVVEEEGLHFLGWRDVPTDNSTLGASARAAQPLIRQVFIDRPEGLVEDMAFERKLYIVRRLVEKAISRSAIPSRGDFYIPSLSCRTIVYKGMLNASQLRVFYPDLTDERVESAIAMVHSRFSTNTFPSWPRAHPYRYISHNGEINTLRGNVNWMHARQSQFSSKLFGDELTKALPAIDIEGSDSAIVDNVLELLYLSGRSVAHALMMMVPGAVAAPRVDGAREASLLRVPLLPDGALGRARVHRLHRRPARRRHARPKRPAPRPLLRHDGQPCRHGLRGRRPGHPAGEDRLQGPAAARPDVPRGHVRAAHRFGRRAQATRRRPSIPTTSGSAIGSSG